MILYCIYCARKRITDRSVLLTGPYHHSPAAVQDKSRVVQEHAASGLGPTGEAAKTFDLQCLSHQEADEKGRTDGDQHRYLPCGHG